MLDDPQLFSGVKIAVRQTISNCVAGRGGGLPANLQLSATRFLRQKNAIDNRFTGVRGAIYYRAVLSAITKKIVLNVVCIMHTCTYYAVLHMVILLCVHAIKLLTTAILHVMLLCGNDLTNVFFGSMKSRAIQVSFFC